jgi:hypothetical protein
MHTMLTVTEWARTHGLSKQSGYNAVKRCGIPLIDGRVDPEVATALYRSRTRKRLNTPSHAKRASADTLRIGSSLQPAQGATMETDAMTDDEQSYHTSRARREAAEAALAQLRLAEQRGELVRGDEVRAALARRVASMREMLLSVAARLAPILAAEPDQATVHTTLETEMRQALAQIAAAELLPAEGQG